MFVSYRAKAAKWLPERSSNHGVAATLRKRPFGRGLDVRGLQVPVDDASFVRGPLSFDKLQSPIDKYPAQAYD